MPRSFVRTTPALAALALAGALAASDAGAQRRPDPRDRHDPRDRYEPRRAEDPNRPLIGFGGGIDTRNVDDDDPRYVLQAGVDFGGRKSGLGVRPEVIYTWRNQENAVGFGTPCTSPLCDFLPGLVSSNVNSRSIGVTLNATYRFGSGNLVRPYLLSGIGVFSTRTSSRTNFGGLFPDDSLGIPERFVDELLRRNRTNVDLGLNAGAGLEFKIGPARLFTEFRYFLADPANGAGYSGMLPITGGIRF